MTGKKSVLGVLFSKFSGILIFLIALAIANILNHYISNNVYHFVVSFFNINLWLIILISLIFFLGELFEILLFPFNLPAPFFNAVGGIFIVTFILRIINFLEIIINLELIKYVLFLIPFVYLLVFIIVLIVGYIKIFMELGLKSKKIEKLKKSNKGNKVGWDEIGEEFKLVVYDLLSKAREKLKSEKGKVAGEKGKVGRGIKSRGGWVGGENKKEV